VSPSKNKNGNFVEMLGNMGKMLFLEKGGRDQNSLGETFGPLDSQATLRRNIKKETVCVYDINCGCS